MALAIFQRPGSNAISTAQGVISTMEKLSKRFPPGVKYAIVYNPTQFIQQSVDAVIDTIGEAIVLVVLVVVVFLQTWRAAIIPLVAIPVSLIGTFLFMAAFGYTLNNLSLFGLVLAIGIVVDDAIVVVENVERNIASGLSSREAARKSMDEVGSALVAIALVLCAVFVPSMFITGISGQFYRQFALTIAGATIISLIVSLTLSPAMCALLLKPHDAHHRVRWWERPIRGFFAVFNWGFDGLARGYGALAGRVVRISALLLGIFGVVGLTLAAIGLYGVMSYSVRSRPREIGIRLALGAKPRGVLSMVLRQGLILTGIGLAIGLAIALVVGRFAASVLYGTSGSDLLTFAVVSVVLVATAAVAILIPARRAAHVEPTVALRYE